LFPCCALGLLLWTDSSMKYLRRNTRTRFSKSQKKVGTSPTTALAKTAAFPVIAKV
jgi:hypothetical protein